MKSYRLFLPLLLIAGSFQTGRAQSYIETDAVSYRYDSTHALVELYYGVLERGLSFHQSGKIWSAVAAGRAEIWQEGKVVGSKNISDTVQCPCTKAQLDSIGANKLLGVAGFSVPYQPGTVAAFLWQRSIQSGKPVFDTVTMPLPLPDQDRSKFVFGSIEAASSIEKANAASAFEKAGYIVTPNPSLIFGENYTKLHYYTELYVPQRVVDPSQSVEVITTIIDPVGKEVVSVPQKFSLNGATIPILMSVDVDGLAGDSYKLIIRAKYEDAVVAQTEKTFFFTSDMKLSEETPVAVSTANVDEEAVFTASEFSKMSDADVEDRIAQSLYLGNDADHKAVKKLSNLADKQRFLYHFWRQQDAAHHAAHPLDIYHQYSERLDEVNKQFTHQKTPGWKTSMGRVYLTYGPPPLNGITKTLFDPSAKPYISWEYNPDQSIRVSSGNRGFFIFLDRQGGGNFVLVHSNVLGEPSEADWYSREAHQLSH